MLTRFDGLVVTLTGSFRVRTGPSLMVPFVRLADND